MENKTVTAQSEQIRQLADNIKEAHNENDLCPVHNAELTDGFCEYCQVCYSCK